MPEMKRAIKDSLFSFIFREPEYTRLLYLSLHPEDTDIQESDLKLVTLANILTTGIYNDLGILVRDKLILMVEAQSTFSMNLALRMLLYLAETYKEYVEEQKLDLYAPKAVTVPRPELYVVYTGDRGDVPDTLRLSDLYQGSGHVELEVKVLRGDEGEKDDILRQYVRFCKIADQQREKYGPTAEAVKETIRLCIEEDVLAPLLMAREKEVSDIMVVLYDQEKVMEIHDYNVAQAAEQRGMERGIAQGMERGIAQGMEKGIAQGMEKGIAQGMERGIAQGMEKGTEKGIRATVSVLRDANASQQEAAKRLAALFDLLPKVAEEKVKLYWGQ